MDVSNGRLNQDDSYKKSKTKTSTGVKNPSLTTDQLLILAINVHFWEKYEGERGPIDMDYYCASRENLEKSLKFQFKRLRPRRMMEAFEHLVFDPYPFLLKTDSNWSKAALPGMEHQSSVHYGNGLANGYRGRFSWYRMGEWSSTLSVSWSKVCEWFAELISPIRMSPICWVSRGFTGSSGKSFLDYF